MKKLSVLVVATLLVVTALVTGVFAAYQSNIDLDGGSVVAKKFDITANNADIFGENVKIAPSESKETVFTIKNNDTEVNVDMDITIDVTAQTGKSAIDKLVVTLYEVTENGDQVIANVVNGTGTISYSEANAFTAGVSATRTFKLVVEWPNGDASDTNFQGENFGNAFTINVVGKQNI